MKRIKIALTKKSSRSKGSRNDDGSDVTRATSASSNSKATLYQLCKSGTIDELKDALKGRHKKKLINLATSSENTTLLMIATKWNRVDIVIYLLKHGANIDMENEKGLTALMIACMHHHTQLVEIFLKYRPDLEKIDNILGNSCLHFSCQPHHGNGRKPSCDSCTTIEEYAPGDSFDPQSSQQMVRALVAAGSNLSALNFEGATVLFMACKAGDVELVSLLLSLKLNQHWGRRQEAYDWINQSRLDGTTPLMISATQSKELVALLLDPFPEAQNPTSVSENLSLKNKDGLTALHYSISYGALTIACLLIQKGANPTDTDNAGVTPLEVCCERGYFAVLSAILEKDCTKIQHINPLGQSCLHVACRGGHSGVVEELLKRNVPHTMADNMGYTPLHMACLSGNLEVVTMLLSAESRENSFESIDPQESCKLKVAKQQYGYLHLAANHGHAHLISVLLKWGCDPTQTNSLGDTALICAAREGYSEVVQKLLSMNSSKSILETKNLNGQTALSVACQKAHSACVRFLLDAGADWFSLDKYHRTPVMLLCHKGDQETIQLILSTTPNPLRVLQNGDADGNTPLHYACRYGRFEIVRWFVEKGAEVSARNRLKITPLHIAVDQGSPDVVKYLVRRRGDVNASAWDGCTPLHIACELGRRDLVSILMKHGCNVFRGTIFGTTPQHLLCRQREGNVDQDVLEYLYSSEHPQSQEIDPNVMDINRETPLHKAARAGNLANIAELLKRKANVTLRNDFGATALDVANLQFQNGAYQLLRRGGESPSNFDLDFDNKFSLAAFFRICGDLTKDELTPDQVYFVPVEAFLNFGKIPSFRECMQQNILIPGSELSPTSSILYIIHEWMDSNDPDQHGHHYEVIKRFLTNHYTGSVDLVWLDFSCLTGLGQRHKFKHHKTSHLFATAACMISAHVILVLPRVEEPDLENGIPRISNLRSCLQRRWCNVEILGCLLSDSEAFCAYVCDDLINFELLRYHSDGTMGFTQASLHALQNLRLILKAEEFRVICLTEDMWLLQPGFFNLLFQVRHGVRYMVQRNSYGFSKVLRFTANKEDVENTYFGSNDLLHVHETLGTCYDYQKNSVSILNLLLFVYCYHTNITQTQLMENTIEELEKSRSCKTSDICRVFKCF